MSTKSTYVADLQAGQTIENEPFLIQDIVARKTKDERAYFLGNLRDKSGTVAFVYWDVPDYVAKWAKTGTVVLITGRVTNYKDALQLTITDFNQAVNPDMGAFLPSSKRSRQSLIAELNDIINLVSQPWRTLLTKLLLDDTDFLQMFVNAPAARKMHHAYIGGLMEHSLSMANLALVLASHYPYVNQDLLLTGALLHDMGKAIEYDVARGFAFSEDGRLVGHIIRAIVLIEQAARDIPDLSEDQLRQLVHLVASHHGTYEWGSPTTPRTLEAILLHQIDLLDSRVQGYFDHLNDDQGNENWTSRHSPMFNTELRYPDDYPRSPLSDNATPANG